MLKTLQWLYHPGNKTQAVIVRVKIGSCDLCLSIFSSHSRSHALCFSLTDLSYFSSNVPNCFLALGLPCLWNAFPTNINVSGSLST